MAKKIPIKIEKINSSIFQLTKISSSIVARLSDKFSFLPPGYRYQPKFRLLGVNGVKVRMVKANGMFPAGLFSEIVTYLTEELGKEVVMSRDVLEHFLPLNDFFEGGIRDDIFSDFEFDGNPVILRDYQHGALESAFENRHCLLNLSTGSGKCLGPDTKIKIKIDEKLAEKYKHLLEKK